MGYSNKGVPVNIHRPGTGDVVEAVRHIRTLHKEIRMVQMMESDELFTYVTWASLCLGIAWLDWRWWAISLRKKRHKEKNGEVEWIGLECFSY